MLYKSLILCNRRLKQMYLSNETVRFSYKGGCGVRAQYVSRRLKEKLAWATDKRLQVINNIILFKTVISLRN